MKKRFPALTVSPFPAPRVRGVPAHPGEQLDFIEAENSTGFHAPEESLRILGASIHFARKGQLVLCPAADAPI
jgi:nitrite reductase (cytochrome c-552)